MPPTRISGVEIKDGSIQRKDLDTTTTGQSVLTSLAISGDFELAHTGADIGTGDVTISLKPTGVVAGRYTVYDVDANGRITGGSSLQASDIPTNIGSYIQNQSAAAQSAALWISGFLGGSDFRAYNGAGTYYVGISAPAILGGSYTFKLPGSYGTGGQVLVGDGAGGLSWANVPAGTVTSVALSVPSIFTVSGSPITGSGTLSFDWNGPSTSLVRADGSTISSASFEPAIAAGLSSQYYRGDKTWATFPTSLPPSGAASGDLSGTYPGPSVVGLRGVALPALGSSALLRYNGSIWVWDASAYLTANQSITLSGDVAGTGTTAITAMIQAGAVTLSKMAALAANSILGNNTGSAATPAALTPTQVKTLLAIAASDVSGLATIATSGSASDLGSGTVPVGRLPLATTSTYGAVAIGTGLDVTTGTISVAYGTTAGTAAQGNDSRLSDSRNPTTHVLDSGAHSISGKTSGQVLLATSPNTFGFTTISGDATVSGAGALTLVNASVTGQALTGYALGSGSAIAATDTILAAFGKTQAQFNSKQDLNSNLTSISGLSTSTTGLVKLSNGVASLDTSAYLTANQSITLSGDATGTGSTAITVTISAATVTGKVLTGYTIGTNSSVASTDTILGAFGKVQGQINALPTVAYVDSALKYRTPGVSDAVSPTFTSNGDGTFTVTGVNVVLNSAADFTGTTAVYNVTGGTFTPTDGAEQFLCVKYNAGSPIYYIENSLTNINQSNVIGVYAVWRVGTEVHSLSFDSRGLGLASKIANMITGTQVYNIARGTALTLGETSTPAARTVTVAAATVYATTDAVTVAAFNSSVGGHRLTLVYHVSGVWTYRNDTQYDNTHYDNGTDLVTLPSNRFGVLWFYRTIGDDTQVFYVMGKALYNNVASAETEPIPTGLPIVVQDHAILIGRIIVQGSASSGTVSQVTSTSFTNSVISDHNALNNIQGGTVAEYFHLTSAEHTSVSAFAALSGTGLVRQTGTGTYALDTSTYLTANQSITLSGDATGTGATAITVAISAATVTGKALTGYAVGTNTALAASDTILAAFGKVQGQINNLQPLNANLTSIASLSAASTGLVKLTNGVASLDTSAYLTANQSITLSGDVAGTGTTAITTTIGAGAVTLAKMANLAANSIIGNDTASAAVPAALSVSQVQTLLGVTDGPFLPLTAGSTKPLSGALYSGGTFTYIPEAPFNLVNSAVATLKTQLNLVNTGGTTGAGSAIDFFTYDVTGGTNPGLRIAALDGNWSADLVIYTKVPGAAANAMAERFRIASAGTITLAGGVTVFAPATTGYASLNIAAGTAPTTPVSGDFWNAAGALKFYNGSTRTVGLLEAAQTWTALQTFSLGATITGAKTTVAAGVAGYASLNIPVGVAPTTPVAGDIWNLSGVLKFYDGATTDTLAALENTSTWTAKQTFATPTTAIASITLPHGTAPTTPVNGDMWTDTTGLRVRINGVTETMPDVGGANTWTSAQTFSGGIVGVTAASNATAGHIGELVQSLVASGSAGAQTSTTARNVTSISLTAGDWDVEASVNFVKNTASGTMTASTISINTTSATITADGSECYGPMVQTSAASWTVGVAHPRKRISIAATTTVYLVARCTFNNATLSTYGTLTARRVR